MILCAGGRACKGYGAGIRGRTNADCLWNLLGVSSPCWARRRIDFGCCTGRGQLIAAKSQKLQILGEWFVRFQLILQFPATTTKDFDVLVALEEELTRSPPPIAKVDGHDFGMGEFNIFVLTDGPKEAFEVAKVLIQQRQPQPQLRAAYREMAEDEFVILWPLGLAEFTVA